MKFANRTSFIGAIVVFLFLFGFTFANRVLAQTGTGSVHGQVTDPSGAIVPGATVQVTATGVQPQMATAGNDGNFNVKGLAAGTYTVTVNASGFAPYTKGGVAIAGGQALTLNISLSVAAQNQQVNVSAEALSLDTTPSNNASAVVLSQKEIDALPDDPDELQADLEALAGPGAGPNGGQMYIDGFTAGQLPPKSSIREIRINQNPFSAQYDTVGFGRIEIFTKPGGNAWHGQTSVNRDQSAFNTRNPFAPSGASFQSTQYNGNIGGSVGKKINLFFNGDYRKIDNSSVIDGEILGPGFNPQPYQALNPLPQSRLNIGPRLDWQLSKSNTLMVRYQFERTNTANSGVGNFILPVQGANVLQYEDQLQATDTQYFGTNVVYETRFQYLRQIDNSVALNEIPSVTVPGAFTGGGGGNNLDLQNHYELQSYTSVAFVKHFLTFGVRLREAIEANNSNSAFYGAFQFSSLTAYQKMIEGLASGLTLPQILAEPGCSATSAVAGTSCGPVQYSVTAGNPYEYAAMFDAGPFIQDDWKVRPNITLSYGLRFETQNYISDHADWAPRLALAWGLGGSKTAPAWVIRAGSGIFYTRFAEADILEALRQNGLTEQQYIVDNPSFYCGPITPLGTTLAGACPTPNQLAALGSSSVPTVYQIAPVLHAPYMLQSSLSLERQLTKAVQVSLTYNNSRGFDQLVTENINTPVLPGTRIATPVTSGGVYPNGTPEYIYQFASAGKFRQNQMIANATIRGSRLTLNAYYVLNYADSTPSGASNDVSNPYDIYEDYGQASGRFGIRNTLFLIGNIRLPWDMTLSPSVQALSGTPYSVTIGRDLLGTGLFNQRPGFVSTASCSNVVITGNIYCTPIGTYNSVPTPGEPIVPINSLRGPANYTINMRLSKTFVFGGRSPEGRAQGAPGFGGGGRGPGGQGGFGGGGFGGGGRGGGGGGFGGPSGPGGGVVGGRFSFTASINARNLLNTVNLAPPVGNLTSPLVGGYESLANTVGVPGGGATAVANRQVYLQGTFNF